MPNDLIPKINQAWDAINKQIYQAVSNRIEKTGTYGTEESLYRQFITEDMLQKSLPEIAIPLNNKQNIKVEFMGSGAESHAFLMTYPNQKPFVVKIKNSRVGVGYASPVRKMEALIAFKNNVEGQKLLHDYSIDFALPLLTIEGSQSPKVTNISDLTIMPYVAPVSSPYSIRNYANGLTLEHKANNILKQLGFPELNLDGKGKNMHAQETTNNVKLSTINIDPFVNFEGIRNNKFSSYGSGKKTIRN